MENINEINYNDFNYRLQPTIMGINILEKYKFELLIISIQLISPISLIGLIIGCAYIFYLIGFERKLDVLSIFILLIPSIVFGYISESSEIAREPENINNWIKIYLPEITTVFLIGPLAISIPFFAALAIPFRLILTFDENPNKLLLFLWFIVLFISLIGLFLAITSGQESAGGLTVGLRIVLVVGAILIPSSINWFKFEKQIMIIVKISVIFFLFGLLNGLWKFVAFAFSAYLIFSNENIVWKILGVVSLIIILTFQFTFTLLLTAVGAMVLVSLYSNHIPEKYFLISKSLRILLFLFPILAMLLLVYTDLVMNNLSMSFFSDRFQAKLFGDRIPIWTFSLDFISKSNFFIVPAARDIVVYDYASRGESTWGVGAHNIYLEMARQLGVFATLLITLILGTITIKSFELIKMNSRLSKFLLSLFAIYLVWGLTGNALIYDGTGFLYWFIIGQIFQSGISYSSYLILLKKFNESKRNQVYSTFQSNRQKY